MYHLEGLGILVLHGQFLLIELLLHVVDLVVICVLASDNSSLLNIFDQCMSMNTLSFGGISKL